MQFEWSEAKRQSNLRKHGIDFRDFAGIFAGITKPVRDDRHSYGEERFLTLGLLDEHVVAVVHTETSNIIRVISIRKATKREQAMFFEGLEN